MLPGGLTLNGRWSRYRRPVHRHIAYRFVLLRKFRDILPARHNQMNSKRHKFGTNTLRAKRVVMKQTEDGHDMQRRRCGDGMPGNTPTASHHPLNSHRFHADSTAFGYSGFPRLPL